MTCVSDQRAARELELRALHNVRATHRGGAVLPVVTAPVGRGADGVDAMA
jgi:hypothetical protein